MLQPVAEYIGLHLYLLASGDRFVNLVQVAGFAGSVVAVSSIAGLLGGDARMQTIAALFCATLPSAILQASGAKNDTLFVLLARRHDVVRRKLAAILTFNLRLGIHGPGARIIFGYKKGTAYLFAAPFLLAIALRTGVYRLSRREIGLAGLALALGTLLINTPQYVRNLDLSGSILGFDSSRKAMGSTAGATRLSDGNPPYRIFCETHRSSWEAKAIPGIVLSTKRFCVFTTGWDWTRRILRLRGGMPSSGHRSTQTTKQMRTIVCISGSWRWLCSWRATEHSAETIGAGLPIPPDRSSGFLAFCVYLKWQPYFSRLELPLFVIAAPLAAYAIASLRLTVLQVALCFVFVSNARLALTQNWTRPLTGPNAWNEVEVDELLQRSGAIQQYGVVLPVR